ncbi:MAG: RNA polymerase sigma factor [Thermoleophilia bacterium]|nr:RNA polymerase sigma factor [Thermoleophilia bacterium]
MRDITLRSATESSDADLLRAGRDDPAAFGRFYRRNAQRLYLWCLRQTGDPQAATDITAEAFAAALEGLGRFRGTEPGSGPAWLFGIARNLVRGWHRRRRVDTAARVRLGMSTPSWVPDEIAEADARMDAERLAERLREAMADLPPGLRDALTLHVLEGRSHGEVADALGISEPNARLRVSRAVRRVRDRLGMEDDR